MTDYFALLEQPRKPWLDAEQLKQKYHGLVRVIHPDRQSTEDDADDAELARINEAYRILADPKLRLHHLLSLEGVSPSTAGQPIPDRLADLFLEISPLLPEIDRLVGEAKAAQSALSKSLLEADIVEKRNRVNALLDRVTDLHQNALEELREVDEMWVNKTGKSSGQLESLYHQLAYLTRWKDLLEERCFQLSI
ncbi:MAG: DnaJ domain-containing protein [Verrucomicrobiota bacterium]|nr:DnaJ domain-containing protein [Verrucomicrobiota bacterium]